jgi:glycosyltransferase involved in cell wall biosynthesis
MNIICLDENYSTTKMLTDKIPEIINNPEDKFESVLFLPKGENRKEEGGLRTKGYFKKSFEDKPLISIITVVYNGEKYLEETIQSVINQTYDNVEYIIIDGGSTDGTLDIIKKYVDRIDYWVSEKDEGIYDAMNKGIKLSNGRIIGLVNADDFIYENTLYNVSTSILENTVYYTYGTVHLMNNRGNIIGEKSSMKKNDIQFLKYDGMPFPHPSVFIDKNVYKKYIGLFNTKFRLSADYDFLLKLVESNLKSIELAKITGVFRIDGQSGGFNTYLDNIKILSEHNVSKTKICKTIFTSYIKVLLTKFLPKFLVVFLKKNKKNSFHKLY